MNVATVFDIFSFLQSASSTTKPSKLRVNIRSSIVARRHASIDEQSLDAYMDRTADDLLAIDEEIRRVNRLIAAKLDNNVSYVIVLEILQDELRRELHLLDHGRVGLVMAFFGATPEKEWEVRQTKVLRKAVGAEFDARMEKMAKHVAEATVAALRSTPQKAPKKEFPTASA